jgi:hypothetical protein
MTNIQCQLFALSGRAMHFPDADLKCYNVPPG